MLSFCRRTAHWCQKASSLLRSILSNPPLEEMSSGTLPLSTYHRAQSLGAGTYGSVITVYNDDGDEFALKLFDEDEDDDDDEVGMSLGALREISVLRLLKGANAHPNIIEIHDVQTGFDDDEVGAGTGGYLAMAMPVFSLGSLAGCISKISNKRQKISIAHGILSAVAHLHENSIIHRDIKGAYWNFPSFLLAYLLASKGLFLFVV